MHRADATDGSNEAASEAPLAIGFYQALRFWLKLGFISFGGPGGQIAIMHQELVENVDGFRSGVFCTH